MAKWDRPESVTYPSVWRTFERRVNGISRQFWIQDLTEEFYEKVLQIMSTDFLRDQPFYKYSDMHNDPVSIQSLIGAWKLLMPQKLSLLCLTKNDVGNTEIAGINILKRHHIHEENLYKKKIKGSVIQKLCAIYDYILDMKNPYLELKIDSYLGALGLYVPPEFRNLGIAAEILKAREDICLAVGINASLSGFTSIMAQKSAANAGFKELQKYNYDDLPKVNPEWILPGISDFTKSFKFMYIKYD